MKLGLRAGDDTTYLLLNGKEAASVYLGLQLALRLSDEGVPEADFPIGAIRGMTEVVESIEKDYPEAEEWIETWNEESREADSVPVSVEVELVDDEPGPGDDEDDEDDVIEDVVNGKKLRTFDELSEADLRELEQENIMREFWKQKEEEDAEEGGYPAMKMEKKG